MHARRCRAIDTRMHIDPSIRACTRVWLQPNADGAADARVHHGIRTRLEARVSIQTHVVQMGISQLRARTRARTRSRRHGLHAPMASTCKLIHIHALIHTYVDVWRARECRFRRAHARTCAHAPTLAWNLHVHPYAHTCTHTYTYTHGDTHLEVACLAAARAHTHAHSCTSACAHARWHACYGRTQTSTHARMHMSIHMYPATAPNI
jgi:hypothetical protein